MDYAVKLSQPDEKGVQHIQVKADAAQVHDSGALMFSNGLVLAHGTWDLMQPMAPAPVAPPPRAARRAAARKTKK